ncbi:hypothetical protein [Ochrovirga pacifica]|uniref:hypothetical protein n=1 Tax=Ochrovirga pacifica TaxID=1042376 RepID=UPI000255800C|nr:hypothetical protein [Ochrovirga pacifica]
MKKFCFIVAFLNSSIFFSQQKWSLEKCISYGLENNLDLKELLIDEKIQSKEIKYKKNERLPIVKSEINNGLTSGFQR